MGCAEVILLSEVRASSQWQGLRDDLHARFDQWLDCLQSQLPDPQAPLAEVTEAVWNLRQDLTSGLSETIVKHAHVGELTRQCAHCPKCDRRLPARPLVARTVETLVGTVQVERPYFYCPSGCGGFYPLDEALGLRSGRFQLDVQQAAADLATELPYETASTLFGRLTGIGVSSERMHTLTHQAAEGLTVLDVAPSRDQIDQLVAKVAAGRFRRPVLVLGIDGAYVPSRPESARGRRPGQSHQRAKRARWRHEWREAKGFRFYLLDGDRIVRIVNNYARISFNCGPTLLSWMEAHAPEVYRSIQDADRESALGRLATERPAFLAHEPGPLEATASAGEPLCRVEGASYAYGERVVAVPELEVRRGEVVALIGDNGSGKTTLAKLAAGLLEPASGTVKAYDARRPALPYDVPVSYFHETALTQAIEVHHR